MKKFVLGIFVGLVLAVLTTVVVVLSLARLGESRPTVPGSATLVLRLEGGLPEKAPVNIPIPFIGSPTPLTVQEIWSGLQRARSDGRVKALVIHLGPLDAGWAKLQELREDLIAFRQSGKPVYVFLKGPRTREYYLASAADKVFINPEDIFDVKGLRAELLYFRNTLSKLGVEAEVMHVGRYKDAGDMWTQTSMSPETRESLGLLLDGVYSQVLQSVASGRKRSVEEVRALIDDGPYTARQAAAKGMVDALRFEDQVYGDLNSALKQNDLKKMAFREYVRALPPERDAKQRVALIVGEGAILRGSGNDAMGTDEGFTSGAFIRMLRQVAEDKSINGVILRVDSPGGDAFASDEILREVKLLRDKKPMVISMSDAAASGGYYVSMTGDPIVAYPNTITGSIGVLFTTVNLKGLYDKLGISRETLLRGKNADVGDWYGPMKPEARQKLQTGLQEFYTEFVKKVADSRRRKYEDVEPLAQGRVWLGQHAKERGLVDELGGLDRAVEAVRKKANMKAGEKVRIVAYPPRRTWLEQLMRSTSESPSVDARLTTLLGFDYRLWLQGGYLRALPFQLVIR
jgi:protease IV